MSQNLLSKYYTAIDDLYAKIHDTQADAIAAAACVSRVASRRAVAI